MSFQPSGGALTTNPTGLQGGGSTSAGAPVFNMTSGMPTPTSGFSPTSGLTGGNGPVGVPGAPGSFSAQTSGTGSGTQAIMTGAGQSASPSTNPVTGENNQTSTGTQTQRQQDRTLGELQSYYGEGMGSYIYNLMQSGGMNTNLVNATDAQMIQAMQGQINQGSGNLNNLLGASGVSANSSSYGLANAQYQADATSQENSLIAQNYLKQYDIGQQLLSGVLGNAMDVNAKGTANQSNWMDYLGQGLQIAGDVASFL